MFQRRKFVVCSKLKASGQRAGASGALVHLRKQTNGHVMLNVANVGDVEVILIRRGQQLTVTRRFTTASDREECLRVCKSDGIISEVKSRVMYFEFCFEVVDFNCHVSLREHGTGRQMFRNF
jgi:serine/threonine protein phosphatase PrpC